MLDSAVDDLDHCLFMWADEKPGADRDWLAEQRYRAVLAVLDGSPVSEVAVRYGVSRQSVYSWKARYAAGGDRRAAGNVAASAEFPVPAAGSG
jgi:transposase-like protein